jgi:sigma-E factor negative regulatory protein RseA
MAVADDNTRDGPWEALSSMVDGEADTAEQTHCLAQWHERVEMRARWHEYQVIGDAMRSAELVGDAERDAAFLRTLRPRLAQQRAPAPSALARSARPVRRWLGALAIAAGIGAVALTLTLFDPVGEVRPEATLAAAPAPTPAAARASAEPPLLVLSGQLIRDARLDRYLAAHRQGATGAALQMPGSVVRSVDTIVLETK